MPRSRPSSDGSRPGSGARACRFRARSGGAHGDVPGRHARGTVTRMSRCRGGRATAMLLASGVLLTGLVAIAPPAVADTGGVVISELNYHAGTDLDTDDFLELVEHLGRAGRHVRLDLHRRDHRHVCPPGPWSPRAATSWRRRTPRGSSCFTASPPTMVYGGNLSNGGEPVALSDAAAVVVDEVTYVDSTPWPPAPDGTGPSLELRGLGYDNTLPESWGASLVAGGTPFARQLDRRHDAVAARGSGHADPAPARARRGRGRERAAAGRRGRRPAVQGDVRRRRDPAVPRRRGQPRRGG